MNRLLRSPLAAFVLLTATCAPAAEPQGAQPSWLTDPAIYEVFVRDFSPAGNFQGLIDGLDRIQAAGTNVIWLMPIYPIGKANRKGPLGSPYAAADYRGINPDFGTHDDFRRLVDTAHKRGLKIILDFVPNHTAFDHVWVTSHPDRYTKNAQGVITHAVDNEGKPTDWTDVADLNYNNPDTRRAVLADMLYWLDEFDIDGYRVDVAGFVPDDFWREAVPALRANRKPILLLAEWGDLKFHDFGFDLTYGWDAYGKIKGVWKGEPASSYIEREVEEMQKQPKVKRLRFTTNHDETAWDNTPLLIFGGRDGARAAFVAQALMPGAPLLYNGQEVEAPEKLPLFEKQTVAWDQPDAANTRAFYRRVIDLAKQYAGADFKAVATDAGRDVIAYQRGSAIVLANTRDRPANVTVAGVRGTRDLLTGGTQNSDTVALGAHGAVILELK